MPSATVLSLAGPALALPLLAAPALMTLAALRVTREKSHPVLGAAKH